MVEKIAADAATMSEALHKVPGLGDLDAGVMDKLEKLEREINYRCYFFPGGQPRLFVEGEGEDTETIKYDNLPGGLDIFATFNPRYYTHYIQQAKQYSFHKHFLYYDGVDVKQINFSNAGNILRNASPETDAKIYYGILAGLRYMDKVDSFVQDQYQYVGMSVGEINKIFKMCSSGADNIIRNCEYQIQNVVKQDRYEFVESDEGWLASDWKYSFAEDLLDDWAEVQEEYEKYKEKLWAAMQNIDNLNLCSNYNSGITHGNVTIQQMNQCIQAIEDQATVETTAPSQTAPATAAPAPAASAASTVSVKIKKFSKVVNDGKYLYEVINDEGKKLYIDDNHNLFYEDKKVASPATGYKSIVVNAEGVCALPSDTFMFEKPATKAITNVGPSTLYPDRYLVLQCDNGAYVYYDKNNESVCNMSHVALPKIAMEAKLQSNTVLYIIIAVIALVIVGGLAYNFFMQQLTSGVLDKHADIAVH
jgi:hypothetical protein